ncbi:MAG: SRPBCC domain-containing protein [Nocardioides sp.]
MSGQTARYTLEHEREFEAVPEKIFGLLTEPARLAKWWGPHGFTTPQIRLELRVGGSYRFTMQTPDGEVFHLSGDFLEVRAPDRLSYTFRWDEPTPDDRETVVLVVLSALHGATRMSLSQGEFATEERLELHRQGWAESFDKLESALREPGS